MNLPICTKDAKEGKLCSKCKQKLESNEINQVDVELSRILFQLAEKETIPNEINLVKTKTIKENNKKDKETVLALVEGNPAVLIGRGGRIIRLISEKLGKDVKVIKNGSPVQIINDLASPVRACGINILYRTDQSEEKYITLPKERKNKVGISVEKMEKLINKLTDEKYKIKYI